MTGDRFVVLGLAPARAEWFARVGRWATSAVLPIDFVRCVSPEELRVRLGSARPFSATLVDRRIPGLDRDLIDTAARAGSAVVVVDDMADRAPRWIDLGAAAVIPDDFEPERLRAVLSEHAAPVGSTDAVPGLHPLPRSTRGFRGRLVAVTGAGGVGRSTIAMALSQALADDPERAHLVLLADLCLDADLALLHDAGDVVPGLQEVVEAHRTGMPTRAEVERLVHQVPARRYDLALGLRRHHDWASLRPVAVGAALDGLLAAYRIVVADIDPDVEGEDTTGSVDIEERNVLARSALDRADVVVVVGLPGVKGTARLVKTILGMASHGVEPDRILAVVNRSPRGPRARAAINRAIADLAGSRGVEGAAVAHVGERRRLDESLHIPGRLPATLGAPVAAAVVALLDGVESPTEVDAPVPVTPGSLGAFAEEVST